MENIKMQISLLCNTLEQMMEDVHGLDYIQIRLKNEDVSLILSSLREKAIREEICSKMVTSAFGETVHSMLSDDYKDRFVAEYMQTKIRYERLKAFNTKIEAAHAVCDRDRVEGALPSVQMPNHDCPDYMLREQQEVMGRYLHILEVRAVIEGIDLGCI